MKHSSQIRIFGIRHHGPGCARSLLAALEEWQPDCLLLEGPPEGDALLPFVLSPDMEPPVALVLYAEDESRRVVFYPFAEFSPEWQALRYGLSKGIAVRFMDLPVAVQFGLDREREERLAALNEENREEKGEEESEDDVSSGVSDPDSAAEASEAEAGEESCGESDGEPEEAGDEDFDYADPLDWLGRAAGYENGESWWNHMVEERADGLELFEAIREAMTTIRREAPGRRRTPDEEREEALREAHMRKCLRQARKEAFGRIAVVCGAWHVPALEDMPPAGEDNALLRGLPSVKTAATWAPWTYAALTRSGGYGAGVYSPAWYEHLWRSANAEQRVLGWLTEAAHLFRQEDLDCSPAHVIEAARLAVTLAALRDRPHAGLPELYESLQSVVCMGDPLPLRLIGRRLITGDRMGSVPDGVPAIPLQRDFEKQKKRLRMKQEALRKTLDLDLRKPTDLERSHLLHRLRLLDIDWGTLTSEGRGKGTFHELWTMEWGPRLLVQLINAGRWGNTVEEAATARVLEQAQEAGLPELARLVDAALLADMPAAISGLVRSLGEMAALTTDTVQLLETIPELARVARYGDVRGTDSAMVEEVLREMIPRAAVGLHSACSGLNEESSAALHKPIQEAHAAIQLVGDRELKETWLQALRRITTAESGVHAVLRGQAVRLLFDGQILSAEDAATHMGMELSCAAVPAESAGWLEAFLGRSAMLLLHDETLWGLVDAWLGGLSEEHFIHVLPLLRRTFTAFSAPERRQLAERSRRAAAPSAGHSHAESWDEERAALPLPFLRRVLGLAGEQVG